MAQRTRVIKCSEIFVNLLNDIIRKFKEKHGTIISYTKATEILAHRVIAVGGVNI